MSGLWGTGSGNVIMTILISMIPVVELRGAIPIAAANGMEMFPAFICAVIGNMIPIPFIILFIRKIFEWMKSRSKRLNDLAVKFEQKAEKNKEKVSRYEWLGLAIFVGIPLPGTGAWTGALVAAMLDMRLKRAFPAIFLGVVIAGIIVSAMTFGVITIVKS